MSDPGTGPSSGRLAVPRWLALAAALALLIVAFREPLQLMVNIWFDRPEYSHGVLIPLIALFLVWQRKDALAECRMHGSWAGVALVAFGLVVHAVGHLATLWVLQQYAFLIVLYGLVLATTGWQVFRLLWMPLLILVFMIPLPEFLLQNFSAHLQLISSQLGVWVIRLFGISVFVEGNVIDLGQLQLQVAEACDGLRYLFPLMTLGFLMAYFYRAAMWKRVLLFLASIPITILMNSLRIGLIGVTVEYWGVKMAQGFLHDFEGWVVFMASTAVMLLLMMLLSRVGKDRGHWRNLFAVELPRRGPLSTAFATNPAGPTLLVAAGFVVAYAGLLVALPPRAEAVPMRPAFTTFPEQLGPWVARTDSLEPIFLEALKLSDYYLADYTRSGQSAPVNLYVAWYDSQRAGQSAHSPRTCLPGGGWQIERLDQVRLENVEGPAGPLEVNRALIALGTDRQLVYYWFQQRGRVVNNEYLVKWFLFWDALTRQRTDGALVRLTTPLALGEDEARGDERLESLARQAAPSLARYIPD
jgi:exosortase D (VPLPA-CTERM-specific)